VPVREQYVADVTNIPSAEGRWSTTHVAIRDTTSLVDEGGGEKGRVVFEYDRNYAMRGTFEPFRQLRDGVWHDYALISSKYTRFEVVDLARGEIVAVEPYPTVSQEKHDQIIAYNPESSFLTEHPVGSEMPGWGFCPIDFRVFDWRERFTDDAPTKTYGKEGDEKPLYSDEKLYSLTGQWAIYSGCVWGDDSSWKLRYIDLSRISEGVVTSEDRFGYFPLGGKLSSVTYDGEEDEFYMSVEVMTSRKTGKSFDPGVKWAKDDDDYYNQGEEND
jgi:hypothetical protein